ncbi:MAG: ABC transporter substrate-binding protein [Caldilinea sp.]
MIRQWNFSRHTLMLGLWMAAVLLAGCAQATQPAAGALRPTELPAIQTVELEVTRVVYRETLVTPTPSPSTSCSPEMLADAGEVVIGALLPLSTPGAWMRSANMQMGLSLALERLNTAGVSGIPLRLVIYDSGDDPARSVQLAEQLIVKDCAVGLIVGLGDASTVAVAEVAERFRKPMIVIDAASPQITESQQQTVFRLAPAAPMVAAMPASWLAEVGDYNSDGVLQAVVIAENSAAGDLFVEQSNEWFPHYDIDAVIHRVDLPMSDFSPEIARLLAMPTIPDAVFIAIGADGALDLHQQLFDAGIRPDKGTLIVNQSRRALDPAAFGLRSQPGVGSIVARRGPWPSIATEAGRYLFDRFRQSGMTWPEMSTFLAHDALLLLVDAMQRAPSLGGTDLINALESSDIELAAGRYTFPYGLTQPPDGETAPVHAWHQWMTPPLLYLMVAEEAQDPATLPAIWPESYRSLPGPLPR